MNETRCIIKLRNQQPIFGFRSFYYADEQLQKHAWLPIHVPKPDERESAAEADITRPPSSEIASSGATTPGAKFAAKSTTTAQFSQPALSKPTVPREFVSGSNNLLPPENTGTASLILNQPDFGDALKRSAMRKTIADRSLDKVLAALERAPAKKEPQRERKGTSPQRLSTTNGDHTPVPATDSVPTHLTHSIDL